MREYLRVLVYPCALGLPPAYADAYREMPVVLEATVEIPTSSTAAAAHLHDPLLTPSQLTTEVALSRQDGGEESVRPLGAHGAALLSPPAFSHSNAVSAAVVTTSSTSRLRAGLDRLRLSRRSASASRGGAAQPLSDRPVNAVLSQGKVDASDVPQNESTSGDRCTTVATRGHQGGVVTVSSTSRAQPSVVNAQLHYVTASLLCELEYHGLPLPSRLAAGLAQASSASAPSSSSSCGAPSSSSPSSVRVNTATTNYTSSVAVLADGVRECVVYPLEEGRYMATVLVPPTVWTLLGPSVVSLIVTTAVKGYEVSGTVAASSAAPVYFPLDARLKENAQAVQAALQACLEEIAGVTAVVQREAFSALSLAAQQQPSQSAKARRTQSRHGATGAASVESRASAQELLRRLVGSRPSALQSGGDAVHAVLDRLVRQSVVRRASTRPAAASSSAGLTRVGVMASEALAEPSLRRFVAVGFGVWCEGLPLHCSVKEATFTAWYEAQLLPAALAVTLAHLQRSGSGTAAGGDAAHTGSSIAAELASQRPTERLFATFSPHQDALLRCSGATGAGFVDASVAQQERSLMAPSTLCLCVADRSGWTVVVLLEPCATPFTGNTLEGIVMGVRTLCTEHFAAPAFQDFMRTHSPAAALDAMHASSSSHGGGGSGALRMLGKFTAALPQRRAVGNFSAATASILALVQSLSVCVRRVSHASGLAFSLSPLGAAQRDVTLFAWSEGESSVPLHAHRMAPVAALLAASQSLKPLSRRGFLQRAAHGGGIRCGAHSLFALTHPTRGGDERMTAVHAVKTCGAGGVRGGDGAAAASTSAILYVVITLSQSAFMGKTKGDSRALLGLTTWLLDKAYV